jgi:predicted acyltransferase
MNAALSQESPPVVPARRGRIVSVDALRGFDLFWIMGAAPLVQALARMHKNAFTTAVDQQLEHVQWQGLHFYDLIYPLFIFLVGVSIVFSLDKLRATEPKRVIVGRILRRGLTLYFLNFIFNGGFAVRWPHMRVVSGVLALIAVSYVIAALIYCFFGARLKVLAGITAALLLGYWALLALTPFPDFRLDAKTVEALAAQAGSHSPAKIAALVPQRVAGVYEEGRNLSNYVDFRVIPGRLHNRYFESQGLLSPISASAVCLLGIFAARLLKYEALDPRKRARGLALGGAAAVVVGLVWGLEFPIVKNLWSSSYCLVAAGYSALVLSVFYLVVDIWGYRRWCQPFVWIGSNAIVLYVLSAVVGYRRLAEYLAGGDVMDYLNGVQPELGNAVAFLVALLLVFSLARFLYRRDIFLRV